MYELKICHLYPDLMRSSGDRGSLIALYKRCQWRGIEVRVSNISINDPLNYNDYDIFFIGGGQAFEQSIIKEDLNEGKKHEIRIFFEGIGHPVLRLIRTKMGPITLDENLLPGEWRYLLKDEIKLLFERGGVSTDVNQ